MANARGRGLGAIEDQIRQARTLMDQLVALNPSSEDKNEVDLKLSKCQALYEAETIVDLPIVTHIASGVCFDELIDKLTRTIAKYRRPPAPPPKPPSEGLPWWAWLGIGVGGLGALGMIAYVLAPKAPPARGKAA